MIQMVLIFSGQHVAGHGERSVRNNRHILAHPSGPWRMGAPGHQQGHRKDVQGRQPVLYQILKLHSTQLQIPGDIRPKKKAETETVTAIPGFEGFSDPITTYRPLLPHQVAIRRRPSLYVINLLMPSGFLAAIDALSFYCQ
ncbi:hypothetical protein H8959_020639 [Pygathrix nigripes]